MEIGRQDCAHNAWGDRRIGADKRVPECMGCRQAKSTQWTDDKALLTPARIGQNANNSCESTEQGKVNAYHDAGAPALPSNNEYHSFCGNPAPPPQVSTAGVHPVVGCLLADGSPYKYSYCCV